MNKRFMWIFIKLSFFPVSNLKLLKAVSQNTWIFDKLPAQQLL